MKITSWFLLALVLTVTVHENLAAGDKEKPAKKPRGKFTIGKETTYVTGPVDKDGYIDYVAALNERLRRGVTLENNANVLLWKAHGPHPNGATMPAEFFRLMGIAVAPEKGDYFIDLVQFLREHLKIKSNEDEQKIFDELEECNRRPWTAKVHPEIAAWLKANEKPLAVIVAASNRSHYYSPLAPPGAPKESVGLLGAPLAGVQHCREFASTLTARALLRVGEGNPDAAWQDLLACHRLARRLGHGGMLIEALVALAVDATAGKADLAFLDRSKPSAKRLDQYLADLRRLPAVPVMADIVDQGERFLFLDVVMRVDRVGVHYLQTAAGEKPKADPGADRVLDRVDWDIALKDGNHWYDRLAKAMHAKTWAERKQQLDQIESEVKRLREKLPFQSWLGWIDPSKSFANILSTMLLPAASRVQAAEERARQMHENLLMAFILARYERDHGRYPDTLDALTPKYLPQLPQDRFSGKPLLYRPKANGYLLYSVGINSKDEGGRGPEDQPRGDDLSVHMPLKK
jgi:hypothetical protein